jgi:hypothetical protein
MNCSKDGADLSPEMSEHSQSMIPDPEKACLQTVR